MYSKIKEFDMFKSGEYIPNSDNKRMTYYKLIDRIPDENLKLMILRQTDKINRFSDILFFMFFIGVLVLGTFLGFAITYSYYKNLGLLP